MNKAYLFFVLFFAGYSLFAQPKSVQITGSVVGEHKKSLFIFFENDIEHYDSIRIPIINGRFKANVRAVLPALCRVHFGENSNVIDFYIDGFDTELKLLSNLTDKETPDSLGGARTAFAVTSVEGSGMESTKQDFLRRKRAIRTSNYSLEQQHSLIVSQLDSFVSRNPSSRLSAYLIAGDIYLLGRSFMLMGRHELSYSEAFDLKSKLASETVGSVEMENLERLLARLDADRNRKQGELFRDVDLVDVTGRVVNTATLRSKYSLIDCWASWCGPCRALSPKLKELYSKYRAKGFEVIGISMDSDVSSWVRAIEQDGLNWIQLRDEKGFRGILARYYDFYGVPLNILLDDKGAVVGFDVPLSEVEAILRKL